LKKDKEITLFDAARIVSKEFQGEKCVPIEDIGCAYLFMRYDLFNRGDAFSVFYEEVFKDDGHIEPVDALVHCIYCPPDFSKKIIKKDFQK
jgi:hypothetical protein